MSLELKELESHLQQLIAQRTSTEQLFHQYSGAIQLLGQQIKKLKDEEAKKDGESHDQTAEQASEK